MQGSMYGLNVKFAGVDIYAANVSAHPLYRNAATGIIRHARTLYQQQYTESLRVICLAAYSVNSRLNKLALLLQSHDRHMAAIIYGSSSSGTAAACLTSMA
jgi:hypothetical protein